MTLPFAADDELMEYSASEHGVLWTPMSHFYAGQGGTRQARLACSQLTTEEIDTGLDRFAALVADRLGLILGAAARHAVGPSGRRRSASDRRRREDGAYKRRRPAPKGAQRPEAQSQH